MWHAGVSGLPSLLHHTGFTAVLVTKCFVVLPCRRAGCDHLLGGAGQAGVAVRVVVHPRFVRGEQWQGILGSLEEQRWAPQAVTLFEGVGKALPFGFRKQEKAEDRQNTEGRQDNMMQEEAGFLLEDDDGEGSPTDHADSQDNAQAGAPRQDT